MSGGWKKLQHQHRCQLLDWSHDEYHLSLENCYKFGGYCPIRSRHRRRKRSHRQIFELIMQIMDFKLILFLSPSLEQFMVPTANGGISCAREILRSQNFCPYPRISNRFIRIIIIVKCVLLGITIACVCKYVCLTCIIGRWSATTGDV